MMRSAHDRQDESYLTSEARDGRDSRNVGSRGRTGALSDSVLDLTEDSLAAASAAADRAYAEARRLVYDRLPIGPVDATRLDDAQQIALGRLAAAEQRLHELRSAAHSDRC